MRFLVDECTGPAVADWLNDQDYDAVSVYDEEPGASDDEVIEWANRKDRILITNDKDFGEKVYRERTSHHGVVLLRLDDERSANKIAVLRDLLDQYIQDLAGQFSVVTEDRVRIVPTGS